jgi:predicted transcriptional regulator of viral defense system
VGRHAAFNGVTAQAASCAGREQRVLSLSASLVKPDREHRVGGGVYRWADAPVADHDLIEIAERVPRATLCLETALARHGLIDSIPVAIDIAIPRGNTRPVLKAPRRLHQFDRQTFDLGRETLDVGARTPIGIYSAERSIVDVIRIRHLQGADLAWEALRRWLRKPGRSPAQLIELAEHFAGAEPAIRTALEVLL